MITCWVYVILCVLLYKPLLQGWWPSSLKKGNGCLDHTIIIYTHTQLSAPHWKAMVAYGLPVMVNDLGGLVANANQVTPLKRENFSTCFSKVSSSISGPCLHRCNQNMLEIHFWVKRRWIFGVFGVVTVGFFSRKSSQKTRGGGRKLIQ